LNKSEYKIRLIDLLITSFPEVRNINIPIRNQWEYIDSFEIEEEIYYLTALPSFPIQTEMDEFAGLIPELNFQLNLYRMYQLFQLLFIPSIKSSDVNNSNLGLGEMSIELKLQGEAKASIGPLGAVFYKVGVRKNVPRELFYKFLQGIECDVDIGKFYIKSLEYGIELIDEDLLRELGYKKKNAKDEWWYKILV
jgi:hypothetical protein